MANSIQSATLLARQAMPGIRKQFPLMELFSFNFSEATASVGQSVNVPVFGESAGVSKTLNSSTTIDYGTEADGNINTVTVSMDQLLFSSHALNIHDTANLSDEVKAQIFVEGMKTVYGKASSLVCATEAGKTYTCASKTAFTVADLLGARGEAAKSGWNVDELVAVLSAKAYNDLLSDDKVVATLTKTAKDAVETGKIVDIFGVKIAVASSITDSFGFLAQKSSFAIAARPTPPIGAAAAEVVYEGGIPFTCKTIADGTHARELYVAETAFGFKKVRDIMKLALAA